MLAICKTDYVGPGEVKRVEVDGLPALAVYNVDGTIFVTDDLCSHGAIALSEGFLEGAEIECPWHGGRFDIATGQPRCLPVKTPIKTYAVTVVGDDVCITV